MKRERLPRGPDFEGPDYVLRDEALQLLGVKHRRCTPMSAAV